MNFFRLRVVNTLLLFFIGIVLGFILKEKFYPAPPPASAGAYKPAYPPVRAVEPSAKAEGEELSDEPYIAPEEEPAPQPAARPEAAPRQEAGAEIETPAEKPAPRHGFLKGEDENFFAHPAQYEGRDLEMDLQMITARKSRAGWRLNLVYSGPGRKIDYLYVDDAEMLGDKPDLRIGYVYKVRFSCGKGETAAGNTLLTISPTGAKAEWATGLSAVE